MTTTAPPDVLMERAGELLNTGRYAEAAVLYRERAKAGLTVNIARNLGLALFRSGEDKEAETWVSLAARNRAGDPDLRQLLGEIYATQGRLELAELEMRTALALKPDFETANLTLAGLYLSQGRYAEGWPLLESRALLHKSVVPPGPSSFPEWRGEALDGKSILILHEQGFGDQIQTVRFVSTLKARGAAKVVLCCRPPLAPLFESLAVVDEVIPLAKGATAAVPRHDYWSRYFSLPRWLGVTLENLPNAPYIAAPDDRRSRWRDMSGIGFVWRCSPTGFNAANKTLPEAEAQGLLDLGLVCLHPEDTGAADFADTAAIIERLDLVISIDTAVAHLAGAMGKPCWTLLPHVGQDWRWLRERSDSPWYPTMRLYRQAQAGDWSDVLAAVKADLASWRARAQG